MDVVGNARRGVVRAADATTAAAGAVGGAVVTGAIGAVEGAATGARNGLKSGGHSSVAAAVTLAAIGAAGLAEWPIVLGVGGAALLIHQLGHRSNGSAPASKHEPSKRPPGKTSAPRARSSGRR